MTYDVPTFVAVQYWNAEAGEWVNGHAGLSLMNPQRYVTKLGERGTIARAIDKDTEQEFYSEGADLL